VPAWQVGATGKGVNIGIVDSGIDTTNPEFAGRISPNSADVAGNRGIQDADGHGTMVALLAAAARNDSGIVGMAWGSTVMAMRADQPGTCDGGSGGDCKFLDQDIAAGINRAVTGGAKVINLSLGGDAPGQAVRDAVARAANSGVLVIVAAGNDGASKDPGVNPNNPDGFATALQQAGNGSVIIAGSVDKTGQISSFSNRAGSEQNWFLAALGEDVCCVYENGTIKTTTQNGQTLIYVESGTSFSAPQISGAAALLMQAFPNLTASQVAQLLLKTARDAGAAGADPIYGRGILDVGAAFAPQGTTALAGSTKALPLGGASLVTSPAMGDAVSAGKSLQAIVLDSYQRAYQVDLAQNLRAARVAPRLAQSVSTPLRQAAGGNGQVAMAFAIDGRAQAASLPWSGLLRLGPEDARGAEVLAGRVVARLAPKTQLAFGFAQGSDGLAEQVRGAGGPAFLIAEAPADDLGFTTRGDLAFALRRQLGRWGLTLSGESGAAVSGAPMQQGADPVARWRNARYSRLGIAIDRRWGDFDAALAASWLSERRTVLGARFDDALGSGGADTLLLDFNGGWDFAPGWRLSAAWREGVTNARSGEFIAPGSRLLSNAWSLDLARSSLFRHGDSLALRVSQPLRVQSGGLRFDLPVAYSYDTLTATRGIRQLSLTPRGREIDTELAWRGPLWGGSAGISVFYRKDPGHYAELPDDRGVAINWDRRF
jgi:hypothetical protein